MSDCGLRIRHNAGAGRGILGVAIAAALLAWPAVVHADTVRKVSETRSAACARAGTTGKHASDEHRSQHRHRTAVRCHRPDSDTSSHSSAARATPTPTTTAAPPSTRTVTPAVVSAVPTAAPAPASPPATAGAPVTTGTVAQIVTPTVASAPRSARAAAGPPAVAPAPPPPATRIPLAEIGAAVIRGARMPPATGFDPVGAISLGGGAGIVQFALPLDLLVVIAAVWLRVKWRRTPAGG